VNAEEWLKKGVAFLEEGKWQEGLEAFEEALKIDPQDAEAWNAKGVALLGLGRYEEAIRAYEKALDIDPQFAMAWVNKGAVLAGVGRHDEAVEAYEKGLEIDSRQPGALVKKGLALAELGRHEEALGAFDKAIDIDPRYGKAWHNKGVELGELGRHEEGLWALEKAIEIDPGSADAWGNKGVALGKLGRSEEALDAFEKALEIDSRLVNAWASKGAMLGGLGRYEEALKALQKALEIDPEHAGAWYNKGVALNSLGRHEEALEAYEKTLDIEPEHAGAWYNKGVVLSGLGRHDGAIEAYDRALDIEPEHVSACYNKGVALSRLGMSEEALKALERAIEIDPRLAEPWHNKGVALERLGRYEEALRAYDNAIEIDPRDSQTWCNKGVALLRLGRYEEALRAYDKAIEIDPHDPQPWRNKGVALSGLGRPDETLEAYERALQIDPENATAWYNNGVELMRLGRHKEALEAFEKAQAVNPQFAEAHSNLGVAALHSSKYADASRHLRIAEELFKKAGREEDGLRARAYALFSQGVKDWGDGRFEDAERSFESAKPTLNMLGEEDLADSLKLVSQLIPIESEFLEALSQKALESIRDRFNRLAPSIDGYVPEVEKWGKMPVKELILAKLQCIITLRMALDFQEDDLYETLTQAESIFRRHSFAEALRIVNKLKNFVLDLKEYPSLEAIPENKKWHLLLDLDPFKFLDGRMTEGAIIRFPGEPYPELTKRSPEVKVSPVNLYFEDPQTPVVVCVAQIDYELTDEFPFVALDSDNLYAKIIKVLSIAKEQRANIVCLPELCMRQEWIEEMATTLEDAVIIAGTYYHERRNSCVILYDGKKYTVSKINPSPQEKEIVPEKGMVPGENIRPFQTRFGVLIPLICLDFRSEHHRIERFVANGGEVHFLFVPSFDKSQKNVERYHRQADIDSEEHRLYVFISNISKGGGTSAFGFEHEDCLRNLASTGCKPKDQFNYKWAEIQRGEEGVIIAVVNVPPQDVVPYSSGRENLVSIDIIPLN